MLVRRLERNRHRNDLDHRAGPTRDGRARAVNGMRSVDRRAGETKQTLAAPSGERWYFRHVPPAHDGTTPVPLVLDLHGYSEGATVHQLMSGLATFGDEHGFVTITPEGTGPMPQWDTTIDGNDVKFVGNLLDKVEEQLCVDTNRIYVTGLSNGAFMTSAIACEFSERVAAVAPVAGVRNLDGCHFDRPVPIVAFHGTADGYVSFDGGLGEKALDLPAPGWIGSFDPRRGEPRAAERRRGHRVGARDHAGVGRPERLRPRYPRSTRWPRTWSTSPTSARPRQRPCSTESRTAATRGRAATSR